MDPNAQLSGQALFQSAQGLANAQTVGPLTELAKQIAANDRQAQASEKQTAGYFNQLGQYVTHGLDAQTLIGANLNQQLSGIANNTQSQLQGIGSDTLAQMNRYAPGNTASSPGMQSLATEIGRQQGLAAQNAGAFRSSGQIQGSNYQGLAASNLGTYGLRGQEALKGIAQSAQVKNAPLNSKIAALQAQRGALLSTDLGKLRQQEISTKIAQQGLGIKTAAQQATAASQAGQLALGAQRNQLTARGQNIQQQNDLANQALHAAQLNQKAGYDNASLALKQAALNLKASGSGGTGGAGGAKPLSTSQQNTLYRNLDEMITLIQQAHAAGHTGPALRQALMTGQMQKGFPAQAQPLVDAAFQLLGYGSINQSTAIAMRNMGLRGGTFRGQPIKVTANFNPNTAGGTVSQAVNGAAGFLKGF